MKVILSRKGMDSGVGGMASPILPDGTLLSLPIPDPASETSYGAVFYKGQSLQEIIYQLNPKFNFSINNTCHLDPDIYNEFEGRADGWKAAFGQCGPSAAHLDHKGVGTGDIFLFYGMYRQTEYGEDGALRYIHRAPVIHIIYGYMAIGGILRDKEEIERLYHWHPHTADKYKRKNRLYLPDTYGTFRYTDSLILTKRGQGSRRLWSLPPFFADRGISVSWQGARRPKIKGSYAELNSSRRGQEFVVTASTKKLEQKLYGWAESLIQNG